uniref:MCC regulator of WNT signaling pathway n=1 Tax=Oryctolagus cuniculus TaxID=9986 RepID=A0A5F9DE74_RABIT
MNSGVAAKYGSDASAELSECEQSHLMREHEVVQERTTLRYEERITELHGVIAELNKKIDRLQGATIREEDECSELRSELSQSQHEVNEDARSMDQDQTSVSIPENQSTVVTADVDNCSDLNSELQRVLTGLENVVCGRKKSSCSLSVAEVDRHIEQLTTASEHCDLAIKTVEEIEGVLGRELYPNLAEERCRWEKELAGLREENESLTAMLCSKEEELNRTKATMNAVREERDRLRRRVRELQTRLQSVQATGPSSPGRLTAPNRPVNPSTGELSTSSSSNDIPIAKIAERVKLSKTRSESSSSDRPVLGSEISSIGVSSSVAEHLAHSLQDCSNIQEIFQTLYSHGSAISESKIREFEVETERLNSRIEHLKSQNDLLTITLEECKSNAERMSMLVGKYESNATALRLALQYSEQCIEAYELLLALAESEQSLILGQFRAAGVGSSPGDQSGDENITQMLKRAHDCRKTAENAAKALLMKLDGSCGGAFTVAGCSVQPWESLSSNSHTSTTSSTASSCDTEFTKEDEQRLKDYIQQLRNDRAAVKLTMLELESIHIDPLSCDVKPRGDSQRLDLENAVLMQELMAMKEEMAELKAQLYLLEKEKKALELKLSTREAQEQAYLVHIEHLKSEVEEQKEQHTRSLSSGGSSGGSKEKPPKGEEAEGQGAGAGERLGETHPEQRDPAPAVRGVRQRPEARQQQPGGGLREGEEEASEQAQEAGVADDGHGGAARDASAHAQAAHRPAGGGALAAAHQRDVPVGAPGRPARSLPARLGGSRWAAPGRPLPVPPKGALPSPERSQGGEGPVQGRPCVWSKAAGCCGQGCCGQCAPLHGLQLTKAFAVPWPLRARLRVPAPGVSLGVLSRFFLRTDWRNSHTRILHVCPAVSRRGVALQAPPAVAEQASCHPHRISRQTQSPLLPRLFSRPWPRRRRAQARQAPLVVSRASRHLACRAGAARDRGAKAVSLWPSLALHLPSPLRPGSLTIPAQDKQLPRSLHSRGREPSGFQTSPHALLFLQRFPLWRQPPWSEGRAEGTHSTSPRDALPTADGGRVSPSPASGSRQEEARD